MWAKIHASSPDGGVSVGDSSSICKVIAHNSNVMSGIARLFCVWAPSGKAAIAIGLTDASHRIIGASFTSVKKGQQSLSAVKGKSSVYMCFGRLVSKCCVAVWSLREANKGLLESFSFVFIFF